MGFTPFIIELSEIFERFAIGDSFRGRADLGKVASLVLVVHFTLAPPWRLLQYHPQQMINMNLLRCCVLGGIFVAGFGVAGCSSSKSASSEQTSSSLGVLSRNDDPAAVAAVRTFYVATNTQKAMSNSFTTRVPLANAFADQIANDMTARGLVQGPPDMVDATVVFTVHTPKPAAPVSGARQPQPGVGVCRPKCSTMPNCFSRRIIFSRTLASTCG